MTSNTNLSQALPQAPAEYSADYFNQLIRALTQALDQPSTYGPVKLNRMDVYNIPTSLADAVPGQLYIDNGVLRVETPVPPLATGSMTAGETGKVMAYCGNHSGGATYTDGNVVIYGAGIWLKVDDSNPSVGGSPPAANGWWKLA